MCAKAAVATMSAKTISSRRPGDTITPAGTTTANCPPASGAYPQFPGDRRPPPQWASDPNASFGGTLVLLPCRTDRTAKFVMSGAKQQPETAYDPEAGAGPRRKARRANHTPKTTTLPFPNTHLHNPQKEENLGGRDRSYAFPTARCFQADWGPPPWAIPTSLAPPRLGRNLHTIFFHQTYAGGTYNFANAANQPLVGTYTAFQTPPQLQRRILLSDP